MGSWGFGIIQNDTAQDSICAVARQIEADIVALPGQGSEEHAGRLGAAVGLLLQFSRYSFDPDNESYAQLISTLTANRDYFNQLGGNSAKILQQVIDGRGSDLASRPGEVDAELDKALHSDENDGFIMQMCFSVSEADLFRHPSAAAYVQQLFDQIVAEVDAGFEEEEIVSDLSREGEFMGSFALLLILPAGHVNPDKFVQWRNRFRDVWANVEPTDDESEERFAENYNRYLELAFQYGIDRFQAD